MIRKISCSSVLAILALLIISSMALAIANPDGIAFTSAVTPRYKVFEDVAETGDMLFVAEGYVDYTVEPTDYTASEAFLFEVLNTTGNVTLLSRPLQAYGNRPISIYQSASQVTSANLTSGAAYILRISGNPLVFTSPTGNSVNVTLADSDWIDQGLGADSEPPSDNNLRNFLIQVMEDVEDNDVPTTDYLITSNGYRYVQDEGISILIEAIPSILTICPVLFNAGSIPMDADNPESTGAYAATITPIQKWGQLTADGLTNIGVFLGVNQQLAGSVVLFIMAIALSVYAYRKTQSGVTVLLLVSSAPSIGGYLGLMPMALAFIFVMVIVILMGFYFFGRSAL